MELNETKQLNAGTRLILKHRVHDIKTEHGERIDLWKGDEVEFVAYVENESDNESQLLQAKLVNDHRNRYGIFVVNSYDVQKV